jgi:SAM-dependent methyltransferase
MAETANERIGRYLKFKETNPGVSFAEWSHLASLRSIQLGGNHATLGPRLTGHENWWDAGLSDFNRYKNLCDIKKSTRVVDYGCGSLRVGGHFIRYLNPNCYFGLDVTMGFIEIGKELVGKSLMTKKRPLFGAIEEASLARAAKFKADVVLSMSVCYHVLPDEAPDYFGNLARLTRAKGAKLFFDASVSDEPVSDRVLSMPKDYYLAALSELEFVEFHLSAAYKDRNQTLGYFEFVRR